MPHYPLLIGFLIYGLTIASIFLVVLTFAGWWPYCCVRCLSGGTFKRRYFKNFKYPDQKRALEMRETFSVASDTSISKFKLDCLTFLDQLNHQLVVRIYILGCLSFHFLK